MNKEIGMKTYSTDLRHFLTESGHFPVDMPHEAKALAEFMGSIVAAATGCLYTNFPETGIECIQEKNGQLCGGTILAGVIINDLPLKPLNKIGWHCEQCNSSGVITGWQGTLWDMLDSLFDEETIH